MPRWNMSHSQGKSDDESEKKEVKNKEVFKRKGWYNIPCKCGHIKSVPGSDLEQAEEWAEKNDCDACYDKQDVAWNTDHYAKMKIYNDVKRAAKIAEAKREAAEAKIKKSEAARAKRFAAENRKNDTKKKPKKGKSAGFKED